MRYLNKIIFINSAAVQYAEIELDGNVHLIGTQGVGKSTLLRAILFFYNANKAKLGIPREKKGFDDYYFNYQNSFIIYEVIKNSIPYCVLAFKTNGKVAFRFFDAAYKRENFVDRENRAFGSWENIRNGFGKEIHYTALITSYEDFRRIIYGDNKGLNADFRKYALIESKQYQNIPRTIQNVFLNSNLEAKFIKDTIINSLSEDEFTIDIENYSKSHLRDFETQINDIKIWFKTNKKGQINIRDQANKVINKYRVFNFLNREKKELAAELNTRMNFIDAKKSILEARFSEEDNNLIALYKKKENLGNLQLKREQKIISEIEYLKKELVKASSKLAGYENKDIFYLVEKIAQKNRLTSEQNALKDEKNILNSSFGLISQKYDALISKVKIQQQEFRNSQDSEINKIQLEFGDAKTTLFETYQKLFDQIKEDHTEEQEKVFNGLSLITENENSLKRKKSELKYRTFFTSEIDGIVEGKKVLELKISTTKSIITDSKNKSETIRKEWEMETKEVIRENYLATEQEIEKQQKNSARILKIENKIKHSKSSLYGWLNEHLPNWENTIGKVINEDDVLFNTDLEPKLVDDKVKTMFGVELNLNNLDNRVKTVAAYGAEIEGYKSKVEAILKTIHQLKLDKENGLQKLKTKFKKKLRELKDSIAENEYNLSQDDQKWNKNKIELNEWKKKASTEKEMVLEKLENELDKITSKKLKAQDELEAIKKGIRRKTTSKEKERDTEITSLTVIKQAKISEINTAISKHKNELEMRVVELKNQQTSELEDKGADTKRLNAIDTSLTEVAKALDFIANNERTVFDYEKDKRELFDKVPELKADKVSLEKKQSTIVEEHKNELNKLNKKYLHQKEIVNGIKTNISEIETDENKFTEFKKSETFRSIQAYLTDSDTAHERTRLASVIISEINDKHYKGIETFKELQQAINAFNGNFSEHNIFSFRVNLNEDIDYLNFAVDLKEFIEADKINEFEKRVNDRFANIIRLIGRETTELNSKKGDIERIIKKINDDFSSKNFVEAIKEMEMRTLESSNPIVKLLIKIQEFNDENSLALGELNLFTSPDSNSKNQKAVDLLKELIKAIEKYKNAKLTLSESFDLQFRIVENDNDSGWVEKLSNVGSEGTDVLVKAMVNILLLNVFKDSASKKFKDFKLHCMMDEIGRLHPNNVKGILRFANERNILLINGSPTSQNATDYKYTYKLAKQQSKTNTKKYITKINRLVKMNTKVLNQ